MKHTQTAIRNIEGSSKLIFIGLACITVFLVATYIFLVNKTVLNAVAKEKIEHQIASINSDLSENEFKYISAKGEVTMELATSLGFVSAADDTTFVTVIKPAETVAVR